MTDSLRLPLRLVGLALLTVVVQESAVSQISIFGVSADFTPLVVVSVGLLAGSLPGALMGFTCTTTSVGPGPRFRRLRS